MNLYIGAVFAEMRVFNTYQTVSGSTIIAAENESDAIAQTMEWAKQELPRPHWTSHRVQVMLVPEGIISMAGYVKREDVAIMQRFDEAYYAMVAGNIAEQPVPYQTVREWLRYVLYSSVETQKEKQAE